MKVNLTDIPVYYVNLEGEDEKRKHTESMLKNLGFKYVHRFNAIRHEAGRICLLYTSPSPRDATLSRMPSSA